MPAVFCIANKLAKNRAQITKPHSKKEARFQNYRKIQGVIFYVTPIQLSAQLKIHLQ